MGVVPKNIKYKPKVIDLYGVEVKSNQNPNKSTTGKEIVDWVIEFSDLLNLVFQTNKSRGIYQSHASKVVLEPLKRLSSVGIDMFV